MKIRFLKDAELEVVTAYDEVNDVLSTEDEFVFRGDEHDVDVDDNDNGTVDIQFGDGSMCYGLSKSLFELV